jgi:hypothetical protein
LLNERHRVQPGRAIGSPAIALNTGVSLAAPGTLRRLLRVGGRRDAQGSRRASLGRQAVPASTIVFIAAL